MRTRTTAGASIPKPSELRQDLVSQDWIAIATGRAKRPHAFASVTPAPQDPIETCPFEDLTRSGNEPIVRIPTSRTGWRVAVIPNKYPAFTGGAGPHPVERRKGPYKVMAGVGFHEVFVLRDHLRHPALLPVAHLRELVHAYVERHRVLRRKSAVNFIAIFHNHGKAAGASLTHPHSQLIALPIVPPDLRRSLEGSEHYFLEKGRCVHCDMVRAERHAKSRIVYENRYAVVFAPFASRAAFELRLFPKQHRAHLSEMTSTEERGVTEALSVALGKLNRGLGNPAYNYFIHTAPTNGRPFPHYHWHLEIVPKLQTWAGFEISTGIEISSIAPEAAASFLRRLKA